MSDAETTSNVEDAEGVGSASCGASRRAFLTGGAVLAATAAVSTAAPAAHAAGDGPLLPPGYDEAWPDGPGRRIRAQRPDADLQEILREIDPANIEKIVRKLVSFGTRHTLSSQDDPERGIGAARDWIAAEMRRYAARSQGRMTVTVPSYVQEVAERIPTPTRISNVVATLRGTVSPNRVYLVSGHYDSRVTDVLDATSDAPGANDDASGVAVAMELARVMASRRTQATVMFAAFAGEEQGLYGSTFMAEQLKQRDVDVQGMITNDIVGSSTGDDGKKEGRTVRLFAQGTPPSESEERAEIRRILGGENDSEARELARFAVEVAGPSVTGVNIRVIYRLDRYLRGGDHTGFLENGFPAIRFTEPNENFAHEHQDVRVEDGIQYGDLVRFCDFDYMVRVARVNAAALWSLAKAPSMPRKVQIDISELTNDTTLLWNANTEKDLAGYEVVWRPTIAPFWTHVIDVGNTTRVTIDLSKDNVVFGVRAVDKAGHRSPAVFPFPQL